MSNYVKTTNFLRKDSLPDTDTDKIIRGSEFDTEFNNLVTAVASKANIVSPEFTGVPRAPTATAGTSTTQLATTAFVAQNAILTGMIVMWSGAVATIPTGYALCNGANGTPDLRNRFVMGAGSTYTPGNTGGSADATLPSHNHSASTSASGSTSSAGNHRHAIKRSPSDSGFGGSVGTDATGTAVIYSEYAGAHTHSMSGVSFSTSVSSKGSSATNANLPPYYALAYIMKT